VYFERSEIDFRIKGFSYKLTVATGTSYTGRALHQVLRRSFKKSRIRLSGRLPLCRTITASLSSDLGVEQSCPACYHCHPNSACVCAERLVFEHRASDELWGHCSVCPTTSLQIFKLKTYMKSKAAANNK
jgi:hypothetical protein